MTKLRGMEGDWPAVRCGFRAQRLRRVLARTVRALLFGTLLGLSFQNGSAHAQPVRMEVRQVVVDPAHGTPVVLLAGGGRLLPIWVGNAEAAAIARALKQEKPSRPRTHDLIQNVLTSLNATLERVTITELRESTYFAVLTLTTNDRRVRIDARPSDAIAVALRTDAPVYATPEVLRQGVELDGSESKPRDAVSRAMGMQVQDLTTDLARLFGATVDTGALVAHVERDSAAHRLGLRRGDVVTQVDGEPVRNGRELLEILHASPNRQFHVFNIQRDGKLVTLVTSPPSR